jgi:hypothetical protein
LTRAEPDPTLPLPDPADPGADEGVTELFGRLIDDGKDYVRAEIEHRRLLAARRIHEARPFIAMGAMGIGVAMAGLIASVVLIGFWLADHMPLPLAALVTAVLACLAGYILFRRAWINVSNLFAQARLEMAAIDRAADEITPP